MALERARFTYRPEIDLEDGEDFLGVSPVLTARSGRECDVIEYNDDGRTVQVTFDGDEEFTVYQDELETLL